ncbi:MAG: hypothetical protein ACLSG5_07885 [Oscillospiraceae bacterium]
MSKNLKYFMREAAEVEGRHRTAPESFKDENGKVIQLEVKVLSSERIRAINKHTTPTLSRLTRRQSLHQRRQRGFPRRARQCKGHPSHPR